MWSGRGYCAGRGCCEEWATTVCIVPKGPIPRDVHLLRAGMWYRKLTDGREGVVFILVLVYSHPRHEQVDSCITHSRTRSDCGGERTATTTAVNLLKSTIINYLTFGIAECAHLSLAKQNNNLCFFKANIRFNFGHKFDLKPFPIFFHSSFRVGTFQCQSIRFWQILTNVCVCHAFVGRRRKKPTLLRDKRPKIRRG